MNKSYTLVWNQATGCWNVASEGTRRRSKRTRQALVVAGASRSACSARPPPSPAQRRHGRFRRCRIPDIHRWPAYGHRPAEPQADH